MSRLRRAHSWHSYDAHTPRYQGSEGVGYELFESSGTPGVVAVALGAPNPSAACRVTSKWQRFERRITLPDVEGKSITPGHYTGVGFDLVVRCAPVLDIAKVAVPTRALSRGASRSLPTRRFSRRRPRRPRRPRGRPRPCCRKPRWHR